MYQENLVKLRLVVEGLTYDASGKVSKRDTMYDQQRLVRYLAATSDQLAQLQRSFHESRSDVDALVRRFENIDRYEPNVDWRRDTTWTTLIGNQTAATTFIDYSTTYYLNTQRPIVGSATTSAEFNPDGTLSKSSATVEDNTLTTVTGAIPFADILTGSGSTAAAEEGFLRSTVRPDIQYTLTLEGAPVIHILAKTTSLTSATCAQQIPIPRDDAAAEYVRKPATAAGADSAAPKGNSVNFTGQITLPKAEH